MPFDDDLECEHCGKITPFASGLSQHIREKHGRTVPCPDCGRMFLTTPDMHTHYQSVHGSLAALYAKPQRTGEH